MLVETAILRHTRMVNGTGEVKRFLWLKHYPGVRSSSQKLTHDGTDSLEIFPD